MEIGPVARRTKELGIRAAVGAAGWTRFEATD